MSTRGLGESGRIRKFFAPLAGPGSLGLTDDAALLDCAPGHHLVVTVDQAVEGVHFLPDDPPDLVARKLLRRNLSDLAAMGAAARHYLLTTALPKSCGEDWLQCFAQGLGEDQRRYGIALIGGDSTSTSGPVVLTLTAIGEVRTGSEIRRSGARAGDRVWVSGTIGDAYLGLKVLRPEGVALPDLRADHKDALTARFRLPEPRTELGPRLAGIAHAMIDVSDGLVADLGHICDASDCAATIRLPALPLSVAAEAALAAGIATAADLAAGGDDYELLFAAPASATAAIERLAAETGVRITAIGEVAAGAGVRLVDASGSEISLAAAGWTHF